MDIRRSNSAQAEVEHPVVRTYPETGRKGLFVNRTFTIRFSGMSEEESAPLLDYFYRHLMRPEFTCRFRWSANAIAFCGTIAASSTTRSTITMATAGSCTASPSTAIALIRQAVSPQGTIEAAGRPPAYAIPHAAGVNRADLPAECSDRQGARR